MFYPKQMVEIYSKDEQFNKFINSIISEADEALDIKEISFKEASNGKGQHGNYTSAAVPFEKNIPILCFAYLYTQKEKYAEKAKKLMLLYSSYARWNGAWAGRSELNNARFCNGMAFGYIMLEDYLTDEEKSRIAEGTFRNGISAIAEDWVMQGTRIHALDTMGHNWWIVCVADALMAAVCMQKQIGLDDEYIEKLRDAVEKWFKYEGNPINVKPKNYCNGGFYESIGYANYALKEYAMCKYVYKHIKGKEIFGDSDYIRNYLMFFVNTLVPSSKNTYAFSFGDGCGFSVAVNWLLGCGTECPEVVWYVKQWQQREISWTDVMFYDKIHDSVAKKPENSSVCYDEIGWAVMRKNFEADSPVLAVKCGDSWNHAHLDAGHFIFSNYGEEIIYDSGHCDYSRKEYVDYYCSSNAHNVILFNGKGQDDRDRLCHARMTGKLYNMTESDNAKYIAADATGPMGRYFRRHIRHFLWLDDFILIYDDIEAHEAGEVNLLMHIEEKHSSEFMMLTKAEKSKIKGKKNKQPDTDVEYDCYTVPTDDDGRVKLVSVLMLNHNVEPSIREEGDFLVVSTGNASVYINTLSDGRIMHFNCIGQIDGYTTDAVMFAEMNKSYFIVNGSMLRQKGESLYDNLYRENIEISK